METQLYPKKVGPADGSNIYFVTCADFSDSL